MPEKEQYQVVKLVLSDGTVARFTGKAVVPKGNPKNLTIIDIKFTEPKELPEGCTFGTVEDL